MPLLDKLLTSVHRCVAIINRALCGVTDSGVQTVKKEILKEIDSRFTDVMKELLHTITTLLDVRYCGKLLPANELDDATKCLMELTESADNADKQQVKPT